MASDAVKYSPIDGVTISPAAAMPSDIKSLFSAVKPRKTSTFAYAFVLIFVAFTIFLAFSPSPNPSSLWFTNIFSISGGGGGHGGIRDSSAADSYRSQFSSIFSYIFPNATSAQPGSVSSDGTNRFNDAISREPGSNSPDAVAETGSSSSLSSNFTGLPAKSNSSESPITDKLNPVAKNSTFQSPIANQTSPVAKKDSSKSPIADKSPTGSNDQSGSDHAASSSKETESDRIPRKPQTSKLNRTAVPAPKAPVSANKSVERSSGFPAEAPSNPAASPPKNQNNGKHEIETLVESLKNCDFFDGEWVRDDSYPLYKPGSCKLIDEQFNCILNGRPDKNFQKLKWKPKRCSLPRLNGARFLEMIRGKRLVFVGDSLNRNMWESLVCILQGSVTDQSKVFEANGRHHFHGEAEYSFVFKDYNCTVEFYVSPFLVQEWEVTDKNGAKKETLRLDLVGKSSEQYKGADIIIFNTGHWWTHEKTSKGEDYYQEGSHVYSELNVLEAFRKALTTWARWVDKNVNPTESLVFFRGYSASHFSGGQWNSGGACDSETQPIKNETQLTPYPPKMQVLERVLRGMKTPVTYLNITRSTDYRKDGHPSIYRKQYLSAEERRSPLRYQDCSHWCLPGVPDSWNEILYAKLLVKLYQRSQTQRRT